MSHYDPIDASARAYVERMPPWRRRQFIFLRVVAAFLILEGIFHWAVICGIGEGSSSRFETMPATAQAVVIWAAIIDPISGVGLWLGAGWAVVLWLLATLSQVILGVWAPDGLSRLLLFTLLELALVVAYAILAVKVAQESDVD